METKKDEYRVTYKGNATAAERRQLIELMFGQKMTGEDALQEALDVGVQILVGRQKARDAADAFAHLTGQIRHDTCWRGGRLEVW